MGLSNEERRLKVHFGLTRLRKKLCVLREHLKEDDRDAAGVIRGAVDAVDRMAGECVARTDSSSMYWVVGPSGDNYQSLYERHQGLAAVGSVDESKPPGDGSLDEFRGDDASLVGLAERLASGMDEGDRLTTVGLALWWDAWDEFAAILYPMGRYDDDLFPKGVKDALASLMGRMANTRYETVYCKYGFGRDPRDVEHALLCKHKAMGVILKKRADEMGDKAARTAPFNALQFWKEIGGMSLVDVQACLERAQDERWSSQAGGEAEPKPDLLYGPPQRSRKELEMVLHKSDDEAVCEKANDELGRVYGCYWGGWRDRFKKKTKARRRRGAR